MAGFDLVVVMVLLFEGVEAEAALWDEEIAM